MPNILYEYMKAINIQQLDEKGEETVHALSSLGMSRYVARTLAYLQHADGVTSVELERSIGLRQPEVSIAMKQLKEHDWINEREEKKVGKGRPYKIYSLKVGFNDIIDQLEKQQKKESTMAQAKIERLKELGK